MAFKTTDITDTPTFLRTLAADFHNRMSQGVRDHLVAVADAVEEASFDMAPGSTSSVHVKTPPHLGEAAPEDTSEAETKAIVQMSAELMSGLCRIMSAGAKGSAAPEDQQRDFVSGGTTLIATAVGFMNRLVIATEINAQASAILAALYQTGRDQGRPAPAPEPTDTPLSYQDRARAELIELDDRTTKLGAFIARRGTPDENPAFTLLNADEKNLLMRQYDAMTDYGIALAQRISLWEVHDTRTATAKTGNVGDTQAARQGDTIEDKDIGSFTSIFTPPT